MTPVRFRARHFPGLGQQTYLAACSLAPHSEPLARAMAAMLAAMKGGKLAWHAFEEQGQAVRTALARLIGARVDQVALLPNASVGAYQVASTLSWEGKPGIVYSDQEFPSLAHVWLAQGARGAAPLAMRNTGAQSCIERQYAERIGKDTRLVSVPHVCYRHGQRFPVARIAEHAHAAGAKVFVDAYQGVGVQAIDVDSLACDYLVGGTMKYLLGLPGLAFLYVRDGLGNDIDPQLTGWFGRVRPFDFDPLALDFPPSAARFETGTPAIPAIYAANAGLAMLSELDMYAVQDHVAMLVGRAAARLQAQGETLMLAPRAGEHGAHIAVHAPKAAALADALEGEGVVASPRGDALRLSFHYYNTVEDIDTCCAALRRARAVLAGV